jgi:hypothetical protein
MLRSGSDRIKHVLGKLRTCGELTQGLLYVVKLRKCSLCLLCDCGFAGSAVPLQCVDHHGHWVSGRAGWRCLFCLSFTHCGCLQWFVAELSACCCSVRDGAGQAASRLLVVHNVTDALWGGEEGAVMHVYTAAEVTLQESAVECLGPKTHDVPRVQGILCSPFWLSSGSVGRAPPLLRKLGRHCD